MNSYTVFEVNLWSYTRGADFMLVISLLGVVNLKKNADHDRYYYFEGGIGFDAWQSFSLSDGRGFGKNVIIFGADMSSLVLINNNKKYIFILGKGPADGLNDTTLTAEKNFV